MVDLDRQAVLVSRIGIVSLKVRIGPRVQRARNIGRWSNAPENVGIWAEAGQRNHIVNKGQACSGGSAGSCGIVDGVLVAARIGYVAEWSISSFAQLPFQSPDFSNDPLPRYAKRSLIDRLLTIADLTATNMPSALNL